MRQRALIAGVVLAAFGAYSLWVISGHGLTGFLTLAAREPWAMQLLLDLMIALVFGIGWMMRDARKRGITAWPFAIVAITCGSPGLLAYLVRRGLAPAPVTPRPGIG